MRRIFTIVLIVSVILMFSSCARKPDGKVNDLFDRAVSANEALEIAKNSDVVVIEKSGCTSGQDVWDRFYARTQKGRADSVLCAHYYTLDKEHVSAELYEEEKDRYPVMYLFMLDFDGKEYSVTIRESSSPENESEETYRYLRYFAGKAPETALFDSYEYYVLTDDEDVTWDEIMKGLYSSDSHTPRYRHLTVCENFEGWKGN